MTITEPCLSDIKLASCESRVLTGLEGRERQLEIQFLIQHKGNKYFFRTEMEGPWFCSKPISCRSCFLGVERVSTVSDGFFIISRKERKGSVAKVASIQVWTHQRRLEPSEMVYVKAVSAWLNLKINTFALYHYCFINTLAKYFGQRDWISVWC